MPRRSKKPKKKPRTRTPVHQKRVETQPELNTVVPRSEFAALAGRSRSAITHATKAGGPLHAAVRPGGIDAEHPAAIAYLAAAPDGDARAELLTLLVRKRRAEVRRIELLNARTDGSLVPRDFVVVHVFGGWDAANRRVLTDAIRTLTTKLFTMARAGAGLEAGEAEAREIISAQMTLGLAAARKAFTNA